MAKGWQRLGGGRQDLRLCLRGGGGGLEQTLLISRPLHAQCSPPDMTFPPSGPFFVTGISSLPFFSQVKGSLLCQNLISISFLTCFSPALLWWLKALLPRGSFTPATTGGGQYY